MIELIGHEENVKLTPQQLDELALLLKREEQLLVEEQIQRVLEKQSKQKEEREDSKNVPAQVGQHSNISRICNSVMFS